MPSSSRASSPLSSATPSPTREKPDPIRTLKLGGASHSPSGEGSRQARSPTSSTVGLSDESELTEAEEDEEQEEDEAVEERINGELEAPSAVDADADDDISGDGEGEAEPYDASLDGQDDNIKVLHPATKHRVVSSMTPPSQSRSPSLTPPPDSAKTRSKPLPPLTPPTLRRLRSAASGITDPLSSISNDDGEEEEAESIDTAISADDVDKADPPPEADEVIVGDSVDKISVKDDIENDPVAEEDGDVTMRAIDVDDTVKHDDGGSVVAEAEAEAEAESAAVVDTAEEEEVTQEQAEVDQEVDIVIDEAAEVPEEVIVDEAETEAAATPTLPAPTRPHSSHAPPPPPAAMKSLLALELKFAALRDKLYLERMEEAAAEEEMLLNGTHPALMYIHQTLSNRRVRLHEIASRRHQAVIDELKKVREAEKAQVWTWWTEQRDQLHWEEFSETWGKRRRLAREKTEIETPRLPRPVPVAGGPRLIKAFDWSHGAIPTKLSAAEAANDLAIMENRRINHPVRHNIAGPSHYAHNTAGPSQPARQHTAGTTHIVNPVRTAPTMSAALERPVMTASTGVSQPRREGRTVPTSSDVFESGPRKRERESGPDAGPGALGLWPKPSDTGTGPARTLPNGGHAPTAPMRDGINGSATIITSPNPPPLGSGLGGKGWTGMTFPSLSDYLNSGNRLTTNSHVQNNQRNPSQTGGMVGGGKIGSMLSPPKAGANIIGGRAPFQSQNAGVTTGTQASRP